MHLDITQRKQAELERTRSRTEIYHLNRVAAMGQLAASLAHELSQPLAAIMSNAEAAQRFAGRPDPDMVEIREALDDITRDDKRARAVIQGMRAMLKKENVAIEPVDLNQIASSVVQIIRNEATLRGMRIELALLSVRRNGEGRSGRLATGCAQPGQQRIGRHDGHHSRSLSHHSNRRRTRRRNDLGD